MSKNINDWLVEDLLDSTQVPTTKMRSHFSRILRNPFYLVWSKLPPLFKVNSTELNKIAVGVLIKD
jgi:hypothetical protein